LYDIIFIQEDHLSNKEFQQLKDKLKDKYLLFNTRKTQAQIEKSYLNKKKKNLEKHIKKTGGFKLSSEKLEKLINTNNASSTGGLITLLKKELTYHSLGYKADTKNHRFIITPIRSSKQQRRKRNLFQRPQRTTR